MLLEEAKGEFLKRTTECKSLKKNIPEYFEALDRPFIPCNRNGVLFPRKINDYYKILLNHYYLNYYGNYDDD